VLDKDTGELVEEATHLAYGSTESDYRPERWASFREDHRCTGKEDDSASPASRFVPSPNRFGEVEWLVPGRVQGADTVIVTPARFTPFF
jgi:hypothetical protein